MCPIKTARNNFEGLTKLTPFLNLRAEPDSKQKSIFLASQSVFYMKLSSMSRQKL